jgi:multiple sugar transport system substrate-binding protein
MTLGRLISEDGRSVRGTLESSEKVASLLAWQALFHRGFAATTPIDSDPFGNAKVAMDWSGHWVARSHLEKKGSALGVMRLPRLESRRVALRELLLGCVSGKRRARSRRAWGALDHGRRARHPYPRRSQRRNAGAALVFVRFPHYAELPYLVFRQQLEQHARPRPHTPFYATLTQRFVAALKDVARGSDVTERLTRAGVEVQCVSDRRMDREQREPGCGVTSWQRAYGRHAQEVS